MPNVDSIGVPLAIIPNSERHPEHRSDRKKAIEVTDAIKQHDPSTPWLNGATRLVVTVIGLWLSLTGCIHGIREILHGATAPGSFLSAQVGAFILLPTYLASGIVTVVVSLMLASWTVGFIHTKRGPIVFLGISILLVLSGGGIAQILVFLIAWAISTRINKPLTWWQRVLPQSVKTSFSKVWLVLFILCMAAISIGVAIWLTGYVPGTTDVNAINHVTWAFLLAGLILLLLTIVAVFAKDTQESEQRA